MTDEIRNHYGRPLPELPPDRVCNSADPRTEQEKAVTGEDNYQTTDKRWHPALEVPKGKFYSTDGKWYDTFEEALRNDYDAAEKKLAQRTAERAEEAAREQVAMAKEVAAMHQPPYASANEVYAVMKQQVRASDMGPNMVATPDGHVPSPPGAWKDDEGKVDMSFLEYFPLALQAICRVSELGTKKYARDGWAHVPNGRSRYRAAHFRHILGIGSVHPGCTHEEQAVWNALASLELFLRGSS